MKIFILLFTLVFSQISFATRIDVTHLDADDVELTGGINHCTPTETNFIREAITKAQARAWSLNREWVAYDLLGVKNLFVVPENRIWTEGDPKYARYQNYVNVMKDTFQKISVEDVNVQCEISSDKGCKDGQTLAYVKFFLGRPIKMIHICPELFSNGGAGIESTLLHELSHYSASTEDYAMDWWNRNDINLERAAKDAYHVERFMNEESKNILKPQIWIWWWPKKATK